MKAHLKTAQEKTGALLRRFRRDAKGNIAIITALVALPLFIGAGVAIDIARASRSQNALQVAIDSAALAAAASDTAAASATTQAQKDARKAALKKVAENFLKANYKDVGADVTVDINVTDTLISLVGRKAFPTTLMNLAGYRSVDISASAEVNLQGGIAENIEIVLVMDITGSMKSDNKLVDAKAAAKALIQQVLGDQPSDSKVRFALVPFSGSVNVGGDKVSSGWIDVNGKAAASKVNFTDTTYYNMKGWNDLKYRNASGQLVQLQWNGCVESRLGALATNDTAPSSTSPDTLFTPYFAPDEPDYPTYRGYGNDYLSDGSNSNETTRLKNQAKYKNAVVSPSASTGPWQSCAPSPIIPLTASRSTIEAGIDAMKADGPTNLVEGIMWGWRVLSPGTPYTEGHAFNDKEWRKVVVMMTDGENDVGTTTGSPPAAIGTNYTAFGYSKVALAKNRFGTTDASQAKAKVDLAFQTACTNLKALNEMRDRGGGKRPSLEVYTIGFKAPSGAETLLKDCASDPELNGNKYNYYVKASSKTDLEGAFKAIGARLRTMYLSK